MANSVSKSEHKSRKRLMKWIRIGCVVYVIYCACPNLYYELGSALWSIVSGCGELVCGKAIDWVVNALNPLN
jgi:hypothetical protein